MDGGDTRAPYGTVYITDERTHLSRFMWTVERTGTYVIRTHTFFTSDFGGNYHDMNKTKKKREKKEIYIYIKKTQNKRQTAVRVQ